MADTVRAESEESKKFPKRKKIHSKNHELKKRQPHRLPASENEIYITKKSGFMFQLDKCRALLNRGENEIILHGLGAAVVRCCNLALQLQRIFENTCQLEVNTSTVDLIVDLMLCITCITNGCNGCNRSYALNPNRCTRSPTKPNAPPHTGGKGGDGGHASSYDSESLQDMALQRPQETQEHIPKQPNHGHEYGFNDNSL